MPVPPDSLITALVHKHKPIAGDLAPRIGPSSNPQRAGITHLLAVRRWSSPMHPSPVLRLIIGTIVVSAVGSLLLGCATTQSSSTDTPNPTPVAEREPGESVVHTASEKDRDYLSSKTPITANNVTLAVNGLSCPLCATNVDKQLGSLRGVQDIRIDFEKGEIDLQLKDPRPSPSSLARAIDQAGFTLVRISHR